MFIKEGQLQAQLMGDIGVASVGARRQVSI